MNQEISLCRKCGLTFGGKMVREGFKCSVCEGELIAVDELLVPTILLLHQNGIETISSCSGHIYNSSGYILIDPQGLPSGFTELFTSPEIRCDRIDNGFMVSWDGISSDYPIEIMQHIFDSTKAVYLTLLAFFHR